MGPEISDNPGIRAHYSFFFLFPGADVSLGAATCLPVHVPSGRANSDAQTRSTATQATLKPQIRSVRVQATRTTREVGTYHLTNSKQVFDTSGWFINASGPSLRIATQRSECWNFVSAR